MLNDHSLSMLADRLNHEPVVVLGCNASEVTTAAVMCCVIGVLVSVPFGLFLGAAFWPSAGLFLGFAAFFGCALGGTYIALHKLQHHKETHGNHYYRELLHCRRNAFGLGGSNVHQESKRYVRGKPL